MSGGPCRSHINDSCKFGDVHLIVKYIIVYIYIFMYIIISDFSTYTCQRKLGSNTPDEGWCETLHYITVHHKRIDLDEGWCETLN